MHFIRPIQPLDKQKLHLTGFGLPVSVMRPIFTLHYTITRQPFNKKIFFDRVGFIKASVLLPGPFYYLLCLVFQAL